MHYLKESLIEDAASTLANIHLSDEGYKEAWSKVLSRYDNKRLIVHTYFNDLFGVEKIKSETLLRSLIDKVDAALRGLKASGENQEHWSSLLAYIVYTRLDSRTRTDFDNTLTDNSTYFSWKSLFKFCDNRANNIEARRLEEPALLTTSSRGFTENKRTFLASRSACVACDGQHLLIDCATFRAKSPMERLKIIQFHRLCLNCFSRAHIAIACPSSKSCRQCQRKHHSMLHLEDTTNSASSNDPQSGGSSSTGEMATSSPKFSSNVSIPRTTSPKKLSLIHI